MRARGLFGKITLSAGLLAAASIILLAISRADGIFIIALILAAVASLTALTTGFIAWRITKPINRITTALNTIALDYPAPAVPIDVSTDGAIGRLEQAFNNMAQQLNRTETRAEAERTRMEAALARLADGIIMTNPNGKVVLANPAAMRLFGFQNEDVRGRSIIEVVRDHEIRALYHKCLSSGNQENRRVDSSSHFLHVIAAPLPADKPYGAILLFQDLTQLFALQTVRQEFVANVSHELRTPLAGIKAMVETLQEGALRDKKIATDFLSRINSEIDEITQIVSELMELSRIETGELKLKLRPHNLNLLLQASAGRFAPQTERKQQTIELKLDHELPAVNADAERIGEVIDNLLHNAIKFTPEGGTITLASMATPNAVNISVSDTGAGIATADLAHVFERFYKADKSRAKEGTGLGLAIAKHIVQAHGGKIQAKSTIGKGSTFSFDLPR
ncbi:MAG: cell wall metabolism sensor histidine kinase WalK [Dehalococcoidia bacterium]|nr:cell wall metabolism sensor histidine kinase WalK [Dehalococcoidia bacterium]